MDEWIALVEFSKQSRRACVDTFDDAHIEVGLKIRVPRRYYPALQDGVTHVAVTAKNAKAKVDDLRAKDAKVSTLRHHALQVHKSLLCATCTLRFVQLALRSFAAHFGFQKVLDGADGRRAFLRDGLKSWRGTLLEVKFGDALTLAETYQHESYTMVRAMLKAVGRDELMFVRAVAGDALAPTTAWRLHNWRPDPAVVDLHGDESARSDL